MKKVKFANSKYGVRTYWFFGWHFLDLESPVYSWKGGTTYFPCCVGSEEQADKALAFRTAKHEVCN
jgi:hypothetical protein